MKSKVERRMPSASLFAAQNAMQSPASAAPFCWEFVTRHSTLDLPIAAKA